MEQLGAGPLGKIGDEEYMLGHMYNAKWYYKLAEEKVSPLHIVAPSLRRAKEIEDIHRYGSVIEKLITQIKGF